MEPARTEASGPRLPEFLQAERDTILNGWLQAARKAGEGHRLPEPELRDHLPLLLDKIAAHEGGRSSLEGAPRLHAEDRLGQGFDLRSVAREVALLRSVILELWAERYPSNGCVPGVIDEIRGLNASLDEVMADSARSYAEARARTLVALGRISDATVGADDLTVFLGRLLRVILETTATADTAKLFLCERREVVLKATAGLEPSQRDRPRMPFGVGFAGNVAREGRPRLIHSAWNDPTVDDPGIASRGIKALYGVPLIQDDRVIGVAEMGSRKSYDFTSDDQQLFRAMVEKATAAIVHADAVQREREAQRVAAGALARLRTMITCAPVGVAFLDSSLQCQLVSQWLAETHGMPLEGQRGRPFREVLPSLADRLEPVLRQVLATRDPVVGMEETFAPGLSGLARTWLVSVYPVATDQSELLGLGVIITDITERKELEDHERQQGALRDLFIGIVGHDLRSPLSAIKLSAGAVMARDDLPEPALRAALRIGATADRMERMISQLLDFARGQLGGGIPVQREPGDMGAILERALEEVRAGHPEANLNLTLTGDGNGSWDADRLAQVFSNLLVNAIRHGKRGAPIDVEMAGTRDGVTVAVHNVGDAIPPEVLPAVFNPFRQGDRALRGGGAEGLGLGLYIVDQIVQSHGGHIEVGSTREAGTTFRVTLPRREKRVETGGWSLPP